MVGERTFSYTHIVEKACFYDILGVGLKYVLYEGRDKECETFFLLPKS